MLRNGTIAGICLSSIDSAKSFSKATELIYIPLSMYEGSSYPTSSPLFVLFSIFCGRHSSGCVMR